MAQHQPTIDICVVFESSTMSYLILINIKTIYGQSVKRKELSEKWNQTDTFYVLNYM